MFSLTAVKPVFTETPIPVEANMGDKVTLNCMAEGNPTPQITWTKSDDEDDRILVIANTLTIIVDEASDFGKYKCSAAVGYQFKTITHETYILLRGTVGYILAQGDSFTK